MAPKASSRMLKKAAQQGRSKRRGDAYSVRYGEPLSEARTPLADFFSVLLEVRSSASHHHRLASWTSSGINSEQVPSRSRWRFARRFKFGKQRSGCA